MKKILQKKNNFVFIKKIYHLLKHTYQSSAVIVFRLFVCFMHVFMLFFEGQSHLHVHTSRLDMKENETVLMQIFKVASGMNVFIVP